MTAALMIETRERTETRQRAAVEPEHELLALAREGDPASIATLLDLTSDSIYSYVFGAIHKSRAAEGITDTVIQRLPHVLRRQRWDTVDALMAALMGIARREVAIYRSSESRSSESREVRAWTRHAILAATSFATIAYACVLAF